MRDVNVGWLLLIVLLTISACKEFREQDSFAKSNLQIQIKKQLAILQLGELRLVIDIHYGGRVIEFSLAGKNALLVTGKYTGSTFWTSPQKEWGWPPPVAIDSGPYTYRILSDRLILFSAIEPESGIQVVKTFSANDRGNGFAILYSIRNLSNRRVKLAPWEVTRISGGYTFFPSSGLNLRSGIPTSNDDGITWYHYQPENLRDTESYKLFADGTEGWIANANPATGLLLIKTYPDINPEEFAPAEAEIEVYASPDKNYIEVEQQGAYNSIEPNSSTDWPVSWYLQHVEKSDIAIGNVQMVDIARRAVK